MFLDFLKKLFGSSKPEVAQEVPKQEEAPVAPEVEQPIIEQEAPVTEGEGTVETK
ncbi:MAG: hypothetical protein WC415_05545 [Patescibacteria group bacterium]|jgi:hypothetical protein